MLMPTSTEFISLCQAQIALLTQGLGASVSVIYLAQELVEGGTAQLVPIVGYPETAINWDSDRSLAPFMATLSRPNSSLQLPAGFVSFGVGDESIEVSSGSNPVQAGADVARSALVPQRQLVLPLLHGEMVLGVLMVNRHDRAWSEWEKRQIQQIATTLALACVLDQRYQWMERDRQQQRVIQAQQRDLLDNLLHQFRNSLTALQTFGKLMLKRLLPEDPNRELANSLVRETARLRELAQQLELSSQAGSEDLELRRLAPSRPNAVGEENQPVAADPPAQESPLLLPPSGGIGQVLPIQPCAVTSVLHPLIDAATPIAQDKAITLLHLIPESLPLVLANPIALREIFNNVLENAIKYTPAGGCVTIAVQVVPGRGEGDYAQVEISVSDTGPGIPAQDLPHIFERRFRGIQAQSDIPGTGLGLAIARTLVEQMQGSIQIISPASRQPLNSSSMTQPEATPGTTVMLRFQSV